VALNDSGSSSAIAAPFTRAGDGSPGWKRLAADTAAGGADFDKALRGRKGTWADETQTRVRASWMSAGRERVIGFGRLEDGLRQASDWYLWGPYVSERQWGTVREDYSSD
jgi:hypothetical protein